MSTKNVTLKEKVNGALGDTIFPATTSPNVYDSAKSQALSQTLVDTPDYEALGYAKFSTASAYSTADKVYYNNELYRFTADKSAGEWDSAKVEHWSVEQDIEAYDEAIRSLIPAQASADNKLADKEYVNDKVSTDTATFRGTFNLVTDLELTTEATQGQIATALGTAISGEDKNDYAFVQIPTSDATPTEIARIDRYKYTGLQWAFEYSLNNSGFTAEQWAAINSGITSSLVTAFGAKYDKPSNGIPVSDMDTSTFDAAPTENSVKPVKSGGILSAIASAVMAVKEWATNLFAKVNGWYSTLVAGAAENLVGHGSVGAEYTFRTSGGTADIGTGTATIDILKGKTLKWNQLVQNGNFADSTTNWNTDRVASWSVSNGVATIIGSDSDTYTIKQSIPMTNGHKYYGRATIQSGDSAIKRFDIGGVVFGNTSGTDKQVVHNIISWSDSTKNWSFGFRDMATSDFQAFTVENVFIVDLTIIFGVGKEPTLAQFKALYPLDYYAYTATPVLINNAAKGIVTTGFNQWDGEYGLGRIDPSNGTSISPSDDGFYSKNFIPVFPSTKYYFRFPSGANIFCLEYDADKNYLHIYTSAKNAELTLSAQTRFIKFYTTDYGASLPGMLCINLSWSGYRNGEYEPYEKHTLYFNGKSGSLATLTGKKIVDGSTEGQESVTIFPDGWKSAGSVYDFGKADSDGYIRKVTKRIGSVDISTISSNNITMTSDELGVRFAFRTNIIGCKNNGYSPKVCNKYQYVARSFRNNPANGLLMENSDSSSLSLGFVIIYDSSYNSVSAFLSGNEGTMLYFELATPEEYLLDTPIPANYIVNDFGTEQRIPEDTANSVMAPIAYDVQYAMNAVDTLRRLPQNYISAESMTQFLAALGTAMNGTWSMTWDSEHERYNFTFTATEEQQQEGE